MYNTYMFKSCIQSFLRLLDFSSDHRALFSSITNSVVHQQYKSDQMHRRKTVNSDRRRVYSSQSLFHSYSERDHMTSIRILCVKVFFIVNP